MEGLYRLKTRLPAGAYRSKAFFKALIAAQMSLWRDLCPRGEFELKSMISLEKKAKKY